LPLYFFYKKLNNFDKFFNLEKVYIYNIFDKMEDSNIQNSSNNDNNDNIDNSDNNSNSNLLETVPENLIIDIIQYTDNSVDTYLKMVESNQFEVLRSNVIISKLIKDSWLVNFIDTKNKTYQQLYEETKNVFDIRDMIDDTIRQTELKIKYSRPDNKSFSYAINRLHEYSEYPLSLEIKMLLYCIGFQTDVTGEHLIYAGFENTGDQLSMYLGEGCRAKIGQFFIPINDITDRFYSKGKFMTCGLIYGGMGHYTVLSWVATTNQFMLHHDGGSNGYERHFNFNYFNQYDPTTEPEYCFGLEQALEILRNPYEKHNVKKRDNSMDRRWMQ